LSAIGWPAGGAGNVFRHYVAVTGNSIWDFIDEIIEGGKSKKPASASILHENPTILGKADRVIMRVSDIE
jgi:hypothetical protein